MIVVWLGPIVGCILPLVAAMLVPQRLPFARRTAMFFAGFSGVLADKIDYQNFFIVTAFFGLPALIGVIIAWKIGFVPEGKVENETAESES